MSSTLTCLARLSSSLGNKEKNVSKYVVRSTNVDVQVYKSDQQKDRGRKVFTLPQN